MTEKDVNINVRAQETEETKRKIEGVADSTEKMGHKTEEAGRRGGAGMAAGAKQLAAYAASAVSATAIIAALTAALKANTEAMRENAEIAEKQQRANLRLQMMGEFFAEHPESREEARAISKVVRRPAEEVFEAWYNLRSKAGFLEDAEQMNVLMEAGELGRTDPEAPLDMIVDMFVLYMKKSGERDANKVQNVIKETITQAGGSAKDVAGQMPSFLPLAVAAKMSPAEAAGLWAYATTEEGEAGKATTALENVFSGLEGDWTPERAKLLKKRGIGRDMPFMQKLETLSQGELSLADAGKIAGDGKAMLSSMVMNIEDLKQTIAAVKAADRADIDLTKDKIAEVFGGDEIARMEEDSRQMAIEIENQRAEDKRAMLYKQKRLRREVNMRQRGFSEGAIHLEKAGMWFQEFLGVPPDKIDDAAGSRSLREVFGTPASELPETVSELDTELARGQGPVIPAGERAAGAIYNTYNYITDLSSQYQPVSGMREDRGIGSRWSQD